MIPAEFEYHRPSGISEALALLKAHGEDARVVAGGHSLIPMMKLRMASVEHLVDLRDVSELKGIRVDANGATIGAMTTQHEIAESAELASVLPIMRETALQIADPQVRYVGTLGGNVANGDPGNDMPGLMQCLGATYTLVGPDGASSREVAAREFYEGPYTTARNDDEILTAVFVPRPPDGTGQAYVKQKRKIGDYATAAAAVQITVKGGECVAASVAMTNLADTPVFVESAGAALVGNASNASARDAAVSEAVKAIDPVADGRGPVEFKLHVAGVVLRRAIDLAFERSS